jgi:hypothetical protein
MRKDPAAVALGRRGGKARLKTMTKEQRTRVARDAARARWARRPETAQELTSVLSAMPCDLSFDEIIAEDPSDL